MGLQRDALRIFVLPKRVASQLFAGAGMPDTRRINMRKIKDVLRLKLDAQLSHERIAASLGISKGVVAKYVGAAAGHVLTIHLGNLGAVEAEAAIPAIVLDIDEQQKARLTGQKPPLLTAE